MNAPRCILLVEDGDIDRSLARRVLGKVWPQTTVLEARDGEEAIEVLRRRDATEPDLIFLDVNMPRMNGFEFLESWYADSGIRIPVVMMLTSSDLPADRELSGRYPCVRNYLVKPITRAKAERLAELTA